MDCGNIVEISMRTIDEVNAKRKLEIMDATTVFGFVFVKQRKKKKRLLMAQYVEVAEHQKPQCKYI